MYFRSVASNAASPECRSVLRSDVASVPENWAIIARRSARVMPGVGAAAARRTETGADSCGGAGAGDDAEGCTRDSSGSMEIPPLCLFMEFPQMSYRPDPNSGVNYNMAVDVGE